MGTAEALTRPVGESNAMALDTDWAAVLDPAGWSALYAEVERRLGVMEQRENGCRCGVCADESFERAWWTVVEWMALDQSAREQWWRVQQFEPFGALLREAIGTVATREDLDRLRRWVGKARGGEPWRT